MKNKIKEIAWFINIYKKLFQVYLLFPHFYFISHHHNLAKYLLTKTNYSNFHHNNHQKLNAQIQIMTQSKMNSKLFVISKINKIKIEN